jgi:hypothetical protein
VLTKYSIVLKFEDHYGSNSLIVAAAPNRQLDSSVILVEFFDFMISLFQMNLVALR